MRFRLSARVSSDRPDVVEPVLRRTVTDGTVRREGEDFRVEAEWEGPSAKELNRAILSELRRTEKRTRLRAEWKSPDGAIERFFDYVVKKVSPPRQTLAGAGSGARNRPDGRGPKRGRFRAPNTR